MFKGIRVEGKNGQYRVIPVKVDEKGDFEDDTIDDAILLNEDDDKVYVVEHNGKMYLPFSSWEDIEEEFEDNVVAALKKDGIFREVEYCDDPDDDDDVCEFRLFILPV